MHQNQNSFDMVPVLPLQRTSDQIQKKFFRGRTTFLSPHTTRSFVRACVRVFLFF
jgi:hypothetical protein